MTLKAVLFDMFDTLAMINREYNYYNPALIAMHQYLVSQGIEVSFEKFNTAYIEARDALYAEAEANLEEPHFNLRVSNALKKLSYNYDVSSPLVIEATGEFCAEFMKYVRIDPNTKSMLEMLHGKYKLGIISNFAIPECVFKLLNGDHLEEWFDVIVISGAVNKRKPSPEIFQSALKALGVSASETAFVGDTIDADVEGSKAVGMKSIYIERREQKASEKFCPDQTIKTLKELPLALERC